MKLIATAAIAAATLATLVAAPTTTSYADSAARGVADPVAGQCHQLTFEQIGAQGDPRPAVPCSGEHTTRTIKVAQLPKGLAYKDAQAFSYKACNTALRAKVGGSPLTLAKTTIGYAFFYPTRAEQQAGSRYVRCDIAVYNGRSLAQLDGAKAPTLTKGLPDKYRRCNNNSNLFFICTRPHSNRAVAAFTVAGRKYPGDEEIRRIAVRRCKELAKPFGYYYVPLVDGWNSGKHEVVCLRTTTK